MKAHYGLAALTLFASQVKAAVSDPSKYVDATIGTINGGHVFAGATLPYGVVKGEFVEVKASKSDHSSFQVSPH